LGFGAWNLQEITLTPWIDHSDADQGTESTCNMRKPMMGQLWTEILNLSLTVIGPQGIKRPESWKNFNYQIHAASLPHQVAGCQYEYECLPKLSPLWSRLVESFTRGNLTYSSDKLPALQGISNAIKLTMYWKFTPEDMWSLPRESVFCKPEETRATS
jgi:hypothetical protein